MIRIGIGTEIAIGDTGLVVEIVGNGHVHDPKIEEIGKGVIHLKRAVVLGGGNHPYTGTFRRLDSNTLRPYR